jgi:large subunit ribosomal protein L5
MKDSNMNKARLQELYNHNIRATLQKQLGLSNVMETPRLVKIVLNVGVKEAVSNSKVLNTVEDVVTRIAGQKPIRTLARKSIASFKLREGMPIGVQVTLRGRNMYEFLDRLLNTTLPKVRDFQGVPTKLDGRGNYNLGLKDWGVFPEVDYGMSEKAFGLNITFHTTAKTNEHGKALLKSFGMPFRT